MDSSTRFTSPVVAETTNIGSELVNNETSTDPVESLELTPVVTETPVQSDKRTVHDNIGAMLYARQQRHGQTM